MPAGIQVRRSRREALAALAAGSAVLGLPLVETAAVGAAAPARKLKVVVAGGHPDDPESTTGGTMARYSDLGHDVVALYLTRGEVGIKGKTPKETAVLRTAEAEKACAILKARPLFADQIDGSTEINSERYEQFFKLLDGEKPDIVFTHWPIDAHRDHRATSLLVYDAWLKSGRTFALYYFEQLPGADTQLFRPSHYVDISDTEDRKRKACYVHSHAPQFFPNFTEPTQRFRGLEFGRKYAEAFVQHYRGPAGLLP
jgi:LmbE family N-acetylglucosaminyl deacetylase